MGEAVIFPIWGNRREGDHPQTHTVGAELNINSIDKVFTRATLGTESFAGRKFRRKKKSRNQGHKLSRMMFFPANFATKTFAIEKKRCIFAWENFRD